MTGSLARQPRLVVAPGGTWGRGIASRLASPTDDTAAGFGDEGAYSTPIAARDQAGPVARDLLVASHLSALTPQVIADVSPGSVVLVHARQGTGPALARDLTPAQRDALRAAALDVRWLDALGGDGPIADETFAEALVSAARGLLRGQEPPGLRRLDAAALAPDDRADEIDFREASHLPTLPASPEGGTDRAWRDACFRFHVRGTGALSPAGSAPGAPVLPVALLALAAHARRAPAFPVLLRRREGRLVGQPLPEAIEELRVAATAAGAAGMKPLVVTLARRIADACGDVAEVAVGAEAVARAGRELLASSGLSSADAASVQAEVDALVAAWPQDARLVPLGADAPAVLHREALRSVAEPAHAAFAERIAELEAQLGSVVLVDDLKSPRGRGVDVVAASLGSLAGQLVDPAVLAARLPAQGGTVPLAPARRARIDRARAELSRWSAAAASAPRIIYVAAPGTRLPASAVSQTVLDSTPLGAAVDVFDDLARQAVAVIAAARTARLELAHGYREELHDEALATLDWEGMTADELAVMPTVAAVVSSEEIRGAGLSALSALIRSTRPVRVLVVDAQAPAALATDARGASGGAAGATWTAGYHADLAALAVAHREAFVVQSALARPGRLVWALGRMAAAPRPAVAVLAAPSPGPPALRWLRAEAALAGRGLPDIIYDPDAGHDAPDRFDIAGNPEPERAWPELRVAARRGDEQVELPVPFTFADAVAMEPACSRHYRVVPPAAWSASLVPLATWLQDPEAASRAREVPYVWVITDERVLQRAIVTRVLAFACRDRLRAWRVVQELGGADNAWARAAAAAARAEANAEAAENIARLRAEHAAELERVRAGTAREAMERLTAVLLERDLGAALALPTRAPARAAEGPAAAPAAAPAASAAAQTPAPADDDEPILGEAYVDSALCTSCNDCTNIGPEVFTYNADKQAYIADPASAPFDVLVKGAELCPARCIHPGQPRPGDPTVTPDLVARARAIG